MFYTYVFINSFHLAGDPDFEAVFTRVSRLSSQRQYCSIRELKKLLLRPNLDRPISLIFPDCPILRSWF